VIAENNLNVISNKNNWVIINTIYSKMHFFLSNRDVK
jgi:hypothetical protein